jgi:hypothetical protein
MPRTLLPLPRRTSAPRTWVRRLAALAAGAGLVLALPAPASGAQVTPGSFTGYGFDQCLTPTQPAMNAWLRHSPFWAVGIYISGDSRACRNQPNLTPAWVTNQLERGWRLLPITLGPQASCNPRFPRYDDDVRINPSAAGTYRAARRQGAAEARSTVADAKRLGIDPGSTLWYDMEAYDVTNRACRASALWFTSAWTRELHRLDYVSGVYSSAGSGIKALDDARVAEVEGMVMPDRIWIARWDGVANTSTSYIRPDGWLPGNRMKQYRGGHDETHGGVTINIDSNYLDLGRGSVAPREPKHCGGVRLSYRRYPTLRAGSTAAEVDAAQCLLRRAGSYDGPITGVLDARTRAAVRDFRDARSLPASDVVGPRVWTALHTVGPVRLIKYGARGELVRRLQRALNAAPAASAAGSPVTGVLAAGTTGAVKRYQDAYDLPSTGVVLDRMWRLLRAGRA